jgi:peptidoglycan/LPS O-acetylase OafA/YrhL
MIYTENDIKQFDKWRGLLSVIVLLCHIFQIFWMPLLGNEGLCISFFSTIANISVVFFFLLSGIQISAGSLNINRNKTFFWKVFLRNRFIRIYPTLIAMLLICYILVLIFPVLNSGSFEIKRLASDKLLAREFFYSKPKSFFKALFMIYPAIFEINGPLWSLFIEWWIYISVMFFAISYSIRSTPLFCFFYCLIGFLILYGIFYFYGVRALTYIIIWYLGFIYTIYLRNNYQLLNWMTFLFLFISFTLILNSGFIILDFSSSSYKKYVFTFFQ